MFHTQEETMTDPAMNGVRPVSSRAICQLKMKATMNPLTNVDIHWTRMAKFCPIPSWILLMSLINGGGGGGEGGGEGGGGRRRRRRGRRRRRTRRRRRGRRRRRRR